MIKHSWKRYPDFNEHGVDIPGKGVWQCERCGTRVPFHANYTLPQPGDVYVTKLLDISLDCDEVIVRDVIIS